MVVEPLNTPDTTISLLAEVSTDRNTAGFAALPEADQSLEFLVENLAPTSSTSMSPFSLWKS